jgi:hypothetical protein
MSPRSKRPRPTPAGALARYNQVWQKILRFGPDDWGLERKKAFQVARNIWAIYLRRARREG